MKEINVLDEAQVRNEFRALYREKGFETCVQVLYKLIISANILAEIMIEEKIK